MPTYSRVAFDRLDRDGSGTIDIVELQALCKSLGRHLSRAELALAAQVLDCNGDGTIEYDEFLRWWRQGRQLGRLGSVGWKAGAFWREISEVVRSFYHGLVVGAV